MVGEGWHTYRERDARGVLDMETSGLTYTNTMNCHVEENDLQRRRCVIDGM
jgi:hypothetical protein